MNPFTPTFTGREDRLPTPSEFPPVRAAEQILATASGTALGPAAGECLLCYVYRMVADFGCNHRWRFAPHFRNVRSPRSSALERRLERLGAFCDCALFGDAYDLHPAHRAPIIVGGDGESCSCEHFAWPALLPPCQRVRAGSTQPCTLWWRGEPW